MGNELDFMTFYNYYIINRSDRTYDSLYVGLWTDADLGDHADDFMGCDVKRGLGYIYNGDDMDGDGNGKTYGLTPPAIGIDFIRGMYCDVNGTDYGFSGIPCGCDESINGQFFNDGVIDNERMGMRNLIWYGGIGGLSDMPQTYTGVYYSLTSRWSNGSHMIYGGYGYTWPSGTGTHADFMFPGDSDPCGFGTNGVPQTEWSEETENNPPSDRRFIISSGPFTMEPGSFNEFTMGVPWARATSGSTMQSVEEMKRADDIAQRMFDECFIPITPIEAPDLTIIPLTNELIFHISVPQGSNNYTNIPEDYAKSDPFITCPVDISSCDTLYRFEGYMVFQLKDASCTAGDIYDPAKSKLVFQCDIKNDYTTLSNYEYNAETAYLEKKVKVATAENDGIKHSFNIKKDLFATGEDKLVNFKTYYYVAVAYAVNQYKEYDPFIPQLQDGQKRPCMVSSVAAFSSPIIVYQGMPHSPIPSDGGTLQLTEYGNRPPICQTDGHGNGFNQLEISDQTLNIIMSGYPWKADTIQYKAGYGPLSIKIVDPLNIPPVNFRLRLITDSTIFGYNSITESKWVCEKFPYTDSSDFVYAQHSISVDFEQIIPQWGISVEMKQVGWPGIVNAWPENNGLITSYITWSDPDLAWLDMQTTRDVDGPFPMNWIRSGKQNDSDNPGYNDYNVPATSNGVDPEEYYEHVIDGLWAPYRLVSRDYVASSTSTSPDFPYGVAYHWRHQLINFYMQHLSSIDFYFTKDKSKWTRSPVVEMCEYDMSNNTLGPCYSEGGQYKFSLRKHASVDKNGSETNIGDSTIEQYSNFIGSTGMGWFPGYCIDIETGERLNIVYGEDSHYPAQNGRDMLWNPTNDFASDLYESSGGTAGDLYVGGKHYIYVFGHNQFLSYSDTITMPSYDYGKYIYTNLLNVTAMQDLDKGNIWRNAMWVTLPILPSDFPVQQNPSDPYYFIRTDCKVSIRIANPYRKAFGEFAYNGSPNDSLPEYYFDLTPYSALKNDEPTAKEALKMINVVPNPYYCGSFYESTFNDFIVKITNLPEQCTISIYSVSGNLIKRVNKNDNDTWYNWDVRDESGKPIGSGVYIIHINAPGIGEKTLKWAGVLREEY